VHDDHDPPRLPPVDRAAADEGLATAYSPELLASLLADGDDDLAAWTILQALADGTRVSVYDGLVADAMRLVGERWATGQWTIAEEHLASQTLLRALERVRPQMGVEGRIGPLAVLAGVAGEHHMIGLVCLDHVLSEGGWTVADLGADVPAADLASFIARNDAALVALTASQLARTEDVIAAVDAVRTADPGRLPILLGGRLGAQPGVAATFRLDWAGQTIAGAARFAETVLVGLSATDT
jgi:methanogenic corrinoid protein MtbC1